MKERLASVIESLLRLPRPSTAQLLKIAPVVVLVVLLVFFLSRNYDTVDFPNYEVPEGFVPLPPPSTLPPGAQLPSLAGVAGTTTTTIPDNVGTSRLRGTVNGPTGPVGGALVRIERSILGIVQPFDAITDGAGIWDAQGLGGGRYHVRAFLPPTLASRTAEVFVLPAGDERRLDLFVEEFRDPSAQVAAAPMPAQREQQVNVAVRVSGRFVDQEGFVGIQPLPGALVEVSSTAGWQRVTGPGSLVSDLNGVVVVTFVCRQVGVVQVNVTVRVSQTDTPIFVSESFDCVDPTTTTTPGGLPSDTTSTTGFPGSSTSSTSTTQP